MALAVKNLPANAGDIATWVSSLPCHLPNHVAVAWEQRVLSREMMAGQALPMQGCRSRRMTEVPGAGVGKDSWKESVWMGVRDGKGR